VSHISFPCGTRCTLSHRPSARLAVECTVNLHILSCNFRQLQSSMLLQMRGHCASTPGARLAVLFLGTWEQYVKSIDIHNVSRAALRSPSSKPPPQYKARLSSIVTEKPIQHEISPLMPCPPGLHSHHLPRPRRPTRRF